MPAISKIRYTNVIYENGAKRYIDNTFQFDGHNGIVLLENGGGKTVFVQTLIQAVLPHQTVAGRKIYETLMLNNTIAHIAVEWILEDTPRRYAVTAVSLFVNHKEALASCKFVNEYTADAKQTIDTLPFVKHVQGVKRAATKEEMMEYYHAMTEKHMRAKVFSENDTLTEYKKYVESNFKIIPSEWAKIALINGAEGGVEEYFDSCKTTGELVDRLLIPTIEEAIMPEYEASGNGFAVLFEKQREHFQKQIQLSKRIKEMQGVIDELGKYNEILKDQYELESAFMKNCAELKGIYHHIEETIALKQEERQLLLNRQQALLQEQSVNAQKMAALQVAFALEWRDKKKVAFDESEQRLGELRLQLNEKSTERNNIEYAQLKQACVYFAETMQSQEAELAVLDADEEVGELTEQLLENGNYLSGCFKEKEALYEKNIAEQLAQAKRIEAETEECQAQVRKLRNRYQETTLKCGDIAATIRACVNQQEEIEKDIFPDSLHRDPKIEFALWQERRAQMHKELGDCQKRIAFYLEEKTKTNLAVPEKKKKLETLQGEEQSNGFEIKEIEHKAEEIRQAFQRVPLLSRMMQDPKDLYQQSERIVSQLGDEVVMLEDAYEKVMIQYRLAHRYLDDYDQSTAFFADANLTKKLMACQGEFSLLKSGTEMFEQICRDGEVTAEQLYGSYPLWASTIITTAAETEAVMKRFQGFAHELTQILIVLSEQEIREIIRGKSLPTLRQIVPTHWQNIMPERFSAWLSNLREHAVSVNQDKKALEVQLHFYRNLVEQVQKFYQLHPFSEYNELVQVRSDLKNQLLLEEKQYQALLDAQVKIEEVLENSRAQEYTVKRQLDHLEYELKQGMRYFELQKQHQAFLEKQAEFTKLQAEIKSELTRKEADERSYIGAKADCKNDIQLLRSKRLEICNLKFYHEVSKLDGEYNSFSYEVLAEKRQSILDQLSGKQQNRGKIQAQLENAEFNHRRVAEQIAKLKETVETVLDEAFACPIDDKQKLVDLQASLKGLKQQIASRQKERDTLFAAYNEAEGAYKSELARYHRSYTELLVFTLELQLCKAAIEEEGGKLARALEEVVDATGAITVTIEELARELTLLQRKNERLLFLQDAISADFLSAEVLQQAPSELKHTIQAILVVMEKRFVEVKAKREYSDKRKASFVVYCENHILSEQMRRRIVDGIQRKTTYDEFLHWHATICKNINGIMTLAEDERKEHYTHIEHMVNHINLHLLDVCDGLKNLGTKTRIKIEDGYKDIYVVHIPQWQDSEAKIRIRQYMDEVTKRLDSDLYRDEDGRENYALIRKELEKCMRTQQLMNKVIGEKSIKVKCRKAASEEYITMKAYSWEESNQWSGGEKWSKNMALFLGCLNYLAEKRNYMKTTNHCTRVVIADNPFGKASSDHVLNPVFFVAKHLGFQIIALTAHDEGGFIRKYFPVVYSCRFAGTGDKNNKVIQAEKEIKTAYFQEHHPSSLARLNEYEEIGLF